MATFFGEVTGLTSRAVEEDIDEEIPSQELVFQETDISSSLKCNIMIVAVGKLAVAFADSYFRSSDSQLVACVKISSPDIGSDNVLGLNYRKKPKTVANFYANPNGILVCEVEDDVPEELNFELCRKLVDYCDSNSEALVLSASHLSKHKSDIHPQEPYLRCLLTPKFIETHSIGCITRLEAPNIVADLPAAILSHYQIHGLCAAHVVCYTDVQLLDSKTVEMFEPVLSMPFVLNKITKNKDAANKLLDFIKSNYKQMDNLYL